MNASLESPMFARPSLLLVLLLFFFASSAQAAKRVDVDFLVRFVPEQDVAEVRIVLEEGSALRYLDFNLSLIHI